MLLSATSNEVAAEGTVTAVAQDSKTYKATFSGSAFSDAAANDTKAVVVSATDVKITKHRNNWYKRPIFCFCIQIQT